jgi:hypothetical protein
MGAVHSKLSEPFFKKRSIPGSQKPAQVRSAKPEDPNRLVQLEGDDFFGAFRSVIVRRAKIAWTAHVDQDKLFAVAPHVGHRTGITDAVKLRSPQNLARLRIKCAKRVVERPSEENQATCRDHG